MHLSEKTPDKLIARNVFSPCVAECDFSAVDIEEKTALHWTASNPDASCIQALVDAYPSLLNKK